jgi:hypothetical protein
LQRVEQWNVLCFSQLFFICVRIGLLGIGFANRMRLAVLILHFAGWSRLCAEVIPLIEDVANELELDVIDVHAVLSEGGVQRSKKEWCVCRIA